MLSDHIDEREKAKVALAYRSVKANMTTEHLADVNKEMAKLEGTFGDRALSLAMDQTSKSSWDASVTPHVDQLPFGMVGQGQQAAVKIALAVSRRADDARVIMIEEPENHQSHTHLNQLLKRIIDLSGSDQQIFVTTHSSFVLNRLGLDNLLFINEGIVSRMGQLPKDTVEYFQKLSGYDTLRMVLATKVVLVEGPSDEILFERFYKDGHNGKRPVEDGIDVISMHGLATRRSLEFARALGKRCAVLRDNDGKDPSDLTSGLSDLISDERQIFIGAVEAGATLEPQLCAVNDDATLRQILGLTDRADTQKWMTNNKTESAFRIATSQESITPPAYFTEAIEFIDGGQ